MAHLPALRAQEVLLSEVRADPQGRWVELHNRSANAIDISTWSLHHASLTVGMPQNYWWGFPSGTVIAPGGYLRVHWYQATPANGSVPGDLWTGNTPYDFLFGLGGETLSGTRGAFALFRSQANSLMSTPQIVEDWVSWGASGYQREPLAIQMGLWTAGNHAPAIPGGQSLARDEAAVDLVATADLAWFLDESPTPLQPNITGAAVVSYGQACVLPGNHLIGLPTLRAPLLPLLGSSQFGLAIDNTTGIYGEFVVIGFGAAAAPAGAPSILPPFAGVGCQEAIDTSALISTWLIPAQLLTTWVPLSLAGQPPAIVGCELHAQALVLDLVPATYPPYQGISNALRVTVGQ
jgi:hypothetical protein